MLDNNYNFKNSFFRSLTLGLLDILEGEVYWTYNFASGQKEVVVPFYFSLGTSERFSFDAFVDDVVSDNRLTDLNADQTPRGILTWTGFDMLTSEMTNPNVYMKMSVESPDDIRTILARTRMIPISCKYDITIFLNTLNDVMECSVALMDTIGVYRYFSFKHNGMDVYAVMQLPDANQIEIGAADKNLASHDPISIKITFEVISYYPSYRRPRTGSLRDISANPDCVDDIKDNPYNYDNYKDIDSVIINPKKTKWYSIIQKAFTNQ